jgi:hypothetical protein
VAPAPETLGEHTIATLVDGELRIVHTAPGMARWGMWRPLLTVFPWVLLIGLGAIVLHDTRGEPTGHRLAYVFGVGLVAAVAGGVCMMLLARTTQRGVEIGFVERPRLRAAAKSLGLPTNDRMLRLSAFCGRRRVWATHAPEDVRDLRVVHAARGALPDSDDTGMIMPGVGPWWLRFEGGTLGREWAFGLSVDDAGAARAAELIGEATGLACRFVGPAMGASVVRDDDPGG